MTSDFLAERRSALEYAFYSKSDQQLLAKLKEELDAEKERENLAAASGISDGAVLDALTELEMTADTIAAMSLAPLVAVAWADGKLDDKERNAVLEACEQQGLSPNSAAINLVRGWLDAAPGDELLDAWTGYIQALGGKMKDTAFAALKDATLGRAQGVAEAAGGILGLNSVSSSEKAVLAKLEAAFTG